MNPNFNRPMKGWMFDDMKDGRTQCAYCRTHIRWEFHLKHPNETAELVVGSECVKSFLADGDPEAALKFHKADWTQRRGYFYKRAFDHVFVIKQNKWGRWDVGYTPSVKAHVSRWTWSK